MTDRAPRSAVLGRLARAVGASGWRVFLVSFVVFFLASAIWSLATPILAAPDEPSHVVKAAAVDRGQLTSYCWSVEEIPELLDVDTGGTVHPVVTTMPKCLPAPDSAIGLVKNIPAFWAILRFPATNPAQSLICFHTHPEIPASCAKSPDYLASSKFVKPGATEYAWVYDARYPPLYYAIVGIPTLLGNSSFFFYLMRLVSAALSALFLALAFTAAVRYSRSRVLFIGLLIACTPMVLFIGGVVNPSGLEIASAVALWTTGAILVTERAADPPRGLVALVAVSALTLELVRSLSPLWLLCSVVFVVGFGSWRGLLALLRRRAVQLSLACVAVGAIAALSWTVVEHATLVYPQQCMTSPSGAFTVMTARPSRSVELNVDRSTVFRETTLASTTKIAYRVVDTPSARLCIGDSVAVQLHGAPALATTVSFAAAGLPVEGTGTLSGTVVYASPVAVGTPARTILEASFKHSGYYVEDMVGVFGWFDTYAPFGTYLAWYVLAGAIVLGAIALGGWRRASLIVLLALATLLIPVAVSSSQALHYGYVWSGRDTLPLAVGLPILSAVAIGLARGRVVTPRLARGLMVFVAGVGGVAQFAAFYEALRRYAVGTSGADFSFIVHPSWRPPIGTVAALVAELVVLGAFSAMFVAAAGRPPTESPRTSVGDDGVEGA